MIEYASNTPVSRPTNEVESPDADFGGIYWSNKKGLVFRKTSERLPFRKPREVRDE